MHEGARVEAAQPLHHAARAQALLVLLVGPLGVAAQQNPVLDPKDHTVWVLSMGGGRLATVNVPFKNASGEADQVSLWRLDVEGADPLQRGRAHGYLLAPQIRDFVMNPR